MTTGNGQIVIRDDLRFFCLVLTKSTDRYHWVGNSRTLARIDFILGRTVVLITISQRWVIPIYGMHARSVRRNVECREGTYSRCYMRPVSMPPPGKGFGPSYYPSSRRKTKLPLGSVYVRRVWSIKKICTYPWECGFACCVWFDLRRDAHEVGSDGEQR